MCPPIEKKNVSATLDCRAYAALVLVLATCVRTKNAENPLRNETNRPFKLYKECTGCDVTVETLAQKKIGTSRTADKKGKKYDRQNLGPTRRPGQRPGRARQTKKRKTEEKTKHHSTHKFTTKKNPIPTPLTAFVSSFSFTRTAVSAHAIFYSHPARPPLTVPRLRLRKFRLCLTVIPPARVSPFGK